MVCDAPYLQNEFGDPRFFCVFNIILSFSTYSQSLKKNLCLGKFGHERPYMSFRKIIAWTARVSAGRRKQLVVSDMLVSPLPELSFLPAPYRG